jgi:hypothetical protein
MSLALAQVMLVALVPLLVSGYLARDKFRIPPWRVLR